MDGLEEEVVGALREGIAKHRVTNHWGCPLGYIRPHEGVEHVQELCVDSTLFG